MFVKQADYPVIAKQTVDFLLKYLKKECYKQQAVS